jgi:hypothetical protein
MGTHRNDAMRVRGVTLASDRRVPYSLRELELLPGGLY